ncbi:MAG: carbon storage regulator [Halieaceae bacterium]|jgi:carbon storage regulator CsrA|nr:carbon storage regulator [Halieaceae bacterium]
MLVLGRKSGEGITLQSSDGEIKISATLVAGSIRLAIDAPDSVKVVRDELIQNSFN